jgi:hypothetical protein
LTTSETWAAQRLSFPAASMEQRRGVGAWLDLGLVDELPGQVVGSFAIRATTSATQRK